MATMKENRGKEIMDEELGLEVQPQPHPVLGESQACPSTEDKRKSLSLGVDLGNLPSRHKEKRVKRKLSKAKDVETQDDQAEPFLVPLGDSIQILDVDSDPKDPSSVYIPSKGGPPSSSQPSQQVPQNLLSNENLAWERFEKAVTDKDVTACYDMSLKDFESSGVHDLFKAMSKFIAASRQATDLDKTRILLERTVQKGKDKSKRWAEMAAKAKEEAKKLKSNVEELKTNIKENDACLELLQKKNNVLNALLTKAKGDAVAKF